MIANLSYSQTDSVKVPIGEIINANLTGDSLDECLEITDSLKVQVSNALQAITAGDSLRDNLREQLLKCDQIEQERVAQVKFEQNVSSAYRKQARIWKIAAFVGIGLTVYQIVK